MSSEGAGSIFDVAVGLASEFGVPITVIDKLEAAHVTDAGRAIFFVLAIWSGPAIGRYRDYLQQVKKEDYTGVRLIAVNHDGINLECQKSIFGDVLHGAGEYFWTSEGEVIGCQVNFAVSLEAGIAKALEELR